MDDATWRRLEDLFATASRLPPEEREREIERIEEVELRTELRTLLAAHEEGDGFLEPALPPAAGLDAPVAGRRLGPWRLNRLLGAGGMGVVWLAERADGRFNQQVAIKFVSPDAIAGFGGAAGPARERAFAARLRSETAILSGLQHPGLCRLLDAGATPTGAPYLVMEYVEGTPWRDYASTLDWRRRLTLLAQVADAVSYAHQRLVVHRDLKPSNILVDRDGHPRLLDFGVAQLLAPGAESTGMTSWRPLTPSYASPERLRGEPPSVGDDLFALGILLYELLTGRHPFAPPGADEAAVLYAIAHAEPSAPSRAAERSWPRSRDRDLDAVARRALARSSAARYQTAAEFADELRRLVEGLPVLARPDSWWYRAERWVRRRPATAAGGVLLGLGLLATTAAAVIGGLEARAQRDFARETAAVVVADLARGLRRMTGPTEARLGLLENAARVFDRLEASGYDRRTLLLALTAHLDLADAYGSLGRVEEAERRLRRARELFQVHYGRFAPQADSAHWARVRFLEGTLEVWRGREAEADRIHREVLEHFQGAGPEAIDRFDANEYLNASSAVAYRAYLTGDYAATERYTAAMLQTARAQLERFPDRNHFRSHVADALEMQMDVRWRTGAFAAGREAIAAAVAARREAVAAGTGSPSERQRLAGTLGKAGGLLIDSMDYALAESLVAEALEIVRVLAAADPASRGTQAMLVSSYLSLGRVRTEAGRPEEARAPLAEARALAERLLVGSVQHARLRYIAAGAYQVAAVAEVRSGHAEEARVAIDRARAIADPLIREPDPASISVYRQLIAYIDDTEAEVALAEGRAEVARQVAQEGVERRRAELAQAPAADNVVELVRSLRWLGDAEAAAGSPERARAAWSEALDQLETLAQERRLAPEAQAWRVDRSLLQQRLGLADAAQDVTS